jgi:hypothetical protein
MTFSLAARLPGGRELGVDELLQQINDKTAAYNG